MTKKRGGGDQPPAEGKGTGTPKKSKKVKPKSVSDMAIPMIECVRNIEGGRFILEPLNSDKEPPREPIPEEVNLTIAQSGDLVGVIFKYHEELARQGTESFPYWLLTAGEIRKSTGLEGKKKSLLLPPNA